MARAFAATGGLILTCDADSVTALDNRTGATRWTATAPGCVSLLVVEAGRAYVHTGDALTALDARSGRRLWTARARHPGSTSARPCGGVERPRGDVDAPPRGVELALFLDDSTAPRATAVRVGPGLARAARDDDEARITARDDLLLLDARRAGSLAHDVLMVSRDTGEVRWRAQRAWRGDYTLTADALYAYSDSRRLLLTIDPARDASAGARARGRLPVRDAGARARCAIRSRRGGPHRLAWRHHRHGLAAATALPVEEVHIEGRRAGRRGRRPPRRARACGSAARVFSTDGRGRFSATVQARGSVAVEWLTDDDADVGRATPRCLSPEPVTVWLDGRRGPYDVTLPVDRSGPSGDARARR